MTEETNDAIARYHALQPSQFHDLVRFEVRQIWHEPEWERETALLIEMRRKDPADSSLLVLNFKGVQCLKYVPAEASVLFFSLLSIMSVAERQMENINFQVFDGEQDNEFSFLCREFEAYIA